MAPKIWTSFLRKFGHFEPENMVDGLGNLDSKNPPNEACEGCIMGKHNRSPFPKKSSRVTKKPLELVHSDVCGPISVESIGGSRYFITFIDDYSRFVVTYTMKRKDEALDKFKEYVAMVECFILPFHHVRYDEHDETEE